MKKIILIVISVVILIGAATAYRDYQDRKLVKALESMSEEFGWTFTVIED